MKRTLLSFLSSAIGFIILAQPGTAAMSMTGATGIVEVPTAHLIPDGKVAFGMGYTDKAHSRYSPEYAQVAYYITAGYLPFLETSFRVTVFPGKSVAGNYGSYKDRMVSLKLRLIDESHYLPSMALGGNDIYGNTAKFNTLYIVMSRSIRLPTIETLDVHLGYASDLMEAQHHGMVGVFGGLEVRLSRFFTLMGEYNTLRYNAGLRITPWDDRANIDLVASGMRRLSGGLSVSFSL